jgi:peptidoglycan DL-endopeptidase CwlO
VHLHPSLPTGQRGGGGTAAGITLSASQLQIAGAGVAVAKQRKLPAQASVDIIAAGMQESHLTNLSGGDRDSVGWLQQRPSQGWGTAAQIMDPVYAAGKFFDKLITISGWQTEAPADAIQAVQSSGDASLYARWVPMARAVAASLLGDTSVALQCAPGGAGTPPGQAPNANAGQVLARARAELGLPYCFAGGTSTGPSHGDGGSGCEGQTVGFDCSGLALYAYAGVGVPLPHSAAADYLSPYGHPVPISQDQPGDLVFWSSNGSQLPDIVGALSGTGAGAAVAMRPAEVAQLAWAAFHPEEAGDLDDVDHAGSEELVDLDWESAGPAAAEELWDRYKHDSGISVSFVMEAAPRGSVKETVLKRLLEPHPHLPRKRVTIYYRPLDPAAAATWADRQRNVVATNHGQLAAARETSTTQAAANARDEARGAAVLRFAVITTITVTDEEQLRRAIKAIRNLHAGARLVMSRAYGQQAGAFSAGLGLGVLLPDHVTLPKVLTE